MAHTSNIDQSPNNTHKAAILNRDRTSKLFLVFLLSSLVLFTVLSMLLLLTKSQKTRVFALEIKTLNLTIISPNEAPNWQSTPVTITGSGFFTTAGEAGIPTAYLGNMHLSSVTFISSTMLTAVVPSNLPGGIYTLTVTVPNSESTYLANAFTVLNSGDGSLGNWQAMSSMVTRRGNFAAAEAKGYIYALGGTNSSSWYLDSVEYAQINPDGTLGSWITTTSMITSRRGVAAVAVGGYLYAIGGEGPSELNSVERAPINPDGSLGPWQATVSMPTARGGLATVAVNGYLYAIGGGGNYLDVVERATISPDGSLGSWQVVSSMTEPRSVLAAVVIGNYIYAIGGQNFGATSLRSVERTIINPDGSLGSWQTVTSMSTPRCAVGAVAVGGYIYAIGGSNCSSVAYDSIEQTRVAPNGSLAPWESIVSMNTPRYAFATVRTSRHIYIIGGQDDVGAILTSVEQAAINFDITAPTADDLSVNGGALNSTSTDVKVGISAFDADSGVAYASLSNDGVMWSDWQDYSTHIAWSLLPGDGLKTVYGRVRDAAGYTSSVVSDTIELDTTVGTDYGFTINDGALFTNEVLVTLSIGARTDTAQMQINNDGSFAGVEWEPYASNKAWQITQYGDYVIPRVVYVRYKDVAGNVSASYQDDIILDVTAPTGSVQVTPGTLHFDLSARTKANAISLGATQDLSHTVYLPLIMNNFCSLPTGPANVTLSLYAEDDVSGVADMAISHLPTFPCSSWELYTTTKVWYAPDDATVVYVRFRDNAGNASEVFTDTIK